MVPGISSAEYTHYSSDSTLAPQLLASLGNEKPPALIDLETKIWSMVFKVAAGHDSREAVQNFFATVPQFDNGVELQKNYFMFGETY
jgi:hypothetical protein